MLYFVSELDQGQLAEKLEEMVCHPFRIIYIVIYIVHTC